MKKFEKSFFISDPSWKC